MAIIPNHAKRRLAESELTLGFGVSLLRGSSEGAASGFAEGLDSALQDVMTNGTDPKAALEKAEAIYNRASRR